MGAGATGAVWTENPGPQLFFFSGIPSFCAFSASFLPFSWPAPSPPSLPLSNQSFTPDQEAKLQLTSTTYTVV